MTAVVISGTGLHIPPYSISNEELVAAFNRYVDLHNERHREAIDRGESEALEYSSEDFIEKASGIQSRYVVDRDGILDPEVMAPRLPERSNEEPSILCEMGLDAARQALDRAGRTPADVDFVVVACSNLQRPYPAVAIEIQQFLGCDGFAYDMNVACSSATFGLQAAVEAIRGGSARGVLVVNPEICSGHLNFRDRDSHFIFGDAATAVFLESAETASGEDRWEVLGTRMKTAFSNNIRNNFGFLNRTHPETRDDADKLFRQHGRRVFKEVVPIVSELIVEHLAELGLEPAQIRRAWLHQANLAMNSLIAKKLFGEEFEAETVPIILDRFANTSSAGSIIAFHEHREGLEAGDLGLICSFGAGYSVGNVVVRKL